MNNTVVYRIRSPLDLQTEQLYEEYRHELQFWVPSINEVNRRHHLAILQASKKVPDQPGLNPVFLLANKWVIKFYSEFRDGARQFDKELCVYRLLANHPEFSAPRLVASGNLLITGDRWHWPYLVLDMIHGDSYANSRKNISLSNQLSFAFQLGRTMKLLHGIQTSIATWSEFATHLQKCRSSCKEIHLKSESLPPQFIRQIDDYLLPVEELWNANIQPSLLHGDLHSNHVIGNEDCGVWKILGIIDFANSYFGNPFFDLLWIHLGLFSSNKQMLKNYFDGYGKHPDDLQRFVHEAMTFSLLQPVHPANTLSQNLASVSPVTSLRQLGRVLWDYKS